MKCPRCAHENEAGAKFCEECAAPLARACARCGRQLSPTAKFCPECAHPAALSSAPPAALQFGAPETYTPKHLAERILISKAALEGERKQVTVLFADLKGSMELLADRDPEEARKILDPVVERMMEAVHRYEGIINQVMGDGIMALFGAPIAHEDHAVRACYAALRMQEQIKRYANEVRRTTGMTVQIRVGLNSGDVVVGAIGSDLRVDYTAIGQTTHLAARMEQMATPGTILVAPDTVALAEGFVQVTALGLMPVKGLSEPIDVYELTGANPLRSRLGAASARGLTPFVGRDAEIDVLRRSLDDARAGRGQVVAIVGDPGVGKSRLVWEFTHSHRTQDWLIMQGTSVSYGKATSYFPVVDLLKTYFKVSDGDTVREIRAKVTGAVLTLDAALQPMLLPLLALLDVPIEDQAWAALDPKQRRQKILAAVKGLILREAQAQPVLVVFEDLHWIDSETQALLDGLVESLPAARLLFLVNYRPEYSHNWGSKSYYTRLRLDPFADAIAAELLDALLGRDASVAPLKTVLTSRTGGNPFFIEESVQSLVEGGTLIGERGAYRLAHAIDTVRVPPTVQAILAARIDRLPGDDKAVLQSAAVIGKDVPLALLAAISDTPDETLEARLASLQAAEFLYETRLFPDREYSFKHALTHEVAYGSIVGERRRALHTRVVAFIERNNGDRLAEDIEVLAEHARRAETWEKAVDYLVQAGSKASGRSANREATTWFEHALTAFDRLADTPERRKQRLKCHLGLRHSTLALGQFDRSLEHAREVETLAAGIGDRRMQAFAAAQVAYAIGINKAKLAEARTILEKALPVAEASGDRALRAVVTLYLGLILLHAGRFRLAIPHLTTSAALDISHVSTFAAGLPSAMAKTQLAHAYGRLGDFDTAIRYSREGIAIAERAHHPYTLINACVTGSLPYIERGEGERASDLLERGITLGREHQISTWIPLAQMLRAQVHVMMRQVDDAQRLGEETLTAFRLAGVQIFETAALIVLARAAALRGSGEEARQLAEQSFALAKERGQGGAQAAALHALAEATEDNATAEGIYRRALAVATQLEARPVEARCHAGLAHVCRRAGKRIESDEHFAVATAMFREMGMMYFLDKAEKEYAAM